MRFYNVLLLAIGAVISSSLSLSAMIENPGDSINPDYVNWYNLSPDDDKILGAAVERAYAELLADQPAKKKIVVAVIDAGVDVEHEDLKDKIWINKDEIPDNGVDDDTNGYVDDIHGWNFLGNAKGENIHYATYEFVRIIRKYDSLFKDIPDTVEVADSLKEQYETYQSCLKDYQETREKYAESWAQIQSFKEYFEEQEAVLQKELDKEKILASDLDSIKVTSGDVRKAVRFFQSIYSSGFTYKSFKNQYDYLDTKMNKHLNKDFEPRTLIGDDLTSMDSIHGNNQVTGPRASHGTLVAGIIAAGRNNELGINGIADSVEIMALRTVPDGDEYDKDVAMSIIYAVDNGADIINMSFGKNYSPQKYLVDRAIKYAADHNVLLIHAAGNQSTDNDEVVHYPANFTASGDTLKAWLEVGAVDREKGKEMVAPFSNYGNLSVDLMAPGMHIVSTMPRDRYDETNGTSFAAPVVSGVAALVWSCYPELTARELKDVLVESAYMDYYKKKVYQPTEDEEEREKVRFYELTKTGGLINAYQAILRAEEVLTSNEEASR